MSREDVDLMVQLNQPENFFSVAMDGYRVSPGQYNTISVAITAYGGTKVFEEYSQTFRKCNFLWEVEEESMFKYYTSKACLHECKIRAAEGRKQNQNLEAQ